MISGPVAKTKYAYFCDHVSCAAQGARAFHSIDGDITAYVEACKAGVRFSQHGLQGCTYDTSTPGVYSITFSVTVPGTSLRASVTRRLVVYPTCGLIEFSCTDLRCSLAELCLSVGGELQVPVNLAPRLLLPQGQIAQVTLQAGSVYGRCSEDVAAGASLHCESGVQAMDPEDGDLTARVLACPPDDCLAFGCPGHEFQVKGGLSLTVRRSCSVLPQARCARCGQVPCWPEACICDHTVHRGTCGRLKSKQSASEG